MLTRFAFVFFVLCQLVFCGLSAVELTADMAYFGGELSCHSDGDTIMYVYFQAENAAYPLSGMIKFCLSQDAGNTWDEYLVSASPISRIRPTLTVLGDRLLVHAGTVFESFDGGVNWAQMPDNPFPHTINESRPYFYERNGYLAEFRLHHSLPEWLQWDYTMDGVDDPTLKPYHAYYEHNRSPHNTPSYWYGIDDVNGIVRINGDMYIKNAGGGDNGGWPRFNAPVIVGGHVLSTPANYPVDQVFAGGLLEEEGGFSLPPFCPVRRDGVNLHGADIYMINVYGSHATGYKAQLSTPRRVSIPVYAEYPSMEDSLFTNTFTVVDTVWSPIEINGLNGNEFFVHGELWIKGTFSGTQTWASSGKLKIIGDITLMGTPLGDDPINNDTDFVNLFSEESIEIKYGYKDPSTLERLHPMCRPDDAPHYIYANLYAIGHGGVNCFEDGVFSFEYQHPHPSTPAQTITIENPDGSQEEVTYDWMDISRRHYPPTQVQPWPSPDLGQQRLDLPWYNPLWPEAKPYLERGVLSLWGNIYSRRRGYIHRSYDDSEYPSNSGIWDIELDMCGYPTDPQSIIDPVLGDIGLIGMNYPGAVGLGVGYKKQYNADLRLDFYRDRYSLYNRFWGTGVYIYVDHPESDPYSYTAYSPLNEAILSKCMDSRGGSFVYAVNDVLLYDTGEDYEQLPVLDLSELTTDNGIILNVQLNQELHPMLHQYRVMDSGEAFTVITEIDPAQPAQIVNTYSYPSSPLRMPEAFCLLPNGTKILARYDSGNIVFSRIQADGTLEQFNTWPDVDQYDLASGHLHLKAPGNNQLDAFLWVSAGTDENALGEVFHKRFQMPVSNDDPGIPAVQIAQMNTYPNPVKHILNIEMKLPAHASHQVEIYNIKGQRVRGFSAVGSRNPADYTYEWDLKDDKSQPVSSGTYILRLKLDGADTIRKRITVY
ncbi:MAG TPA: T9SS type A sorting domain-containing protein [Candidatus Cloacimonadota bacterium]|nr:T9SS type A sorting domain-containing protein [Candidatus Cloacimonadota bacterium]